MWLGCRFLISYPRINYINVSTTGWPLVSPMAPGTVTHRALRNRSKACFCRWKCLEQGRTRSYLCSGLLRPPQIGHSPLLVWNQGAALITNTPSTSKEASFRRTDVPSPLAPCLLLLTHWLLEQIYPFKGYVQVLFYSISQFCVVCNGLYILLKYLVSTQRACIPCWDRK